MSSYVTDTQALVEFMMGQRVINDAAHQAYLSADKGDDIIIIPAIVLMEVMYLFEKNRIQIGLLQTEGLMESQNYHLNRSALRFLKLRPRSTPLSRNAYLCANFSSASPTSFRRVANLPDRQISRRQYPDAARPKKTKKA